MKDIFDMYSRAFEAWQNADPLTKKIFFWIFVVLVAATVAEQVALP